MTTTAADIRRIHTSELRARSFPAFHDTGMLALLDKLAFGSPLILKGAKGTGKTMGVEQWACTRKVPFLRKSCTADTSDRQLLGSHTLKSFDESFFTMGCLTASVDVANETGKCVLVLEEINALNEEAQKAINGIADYRKEVDLPHVGRVFRLREEVRATQAGTILELEPVNEYSTSLVVRGADGTIVDHGLVPMASLGPNLSEGAEVAEKQLLVEGAQLWVVGTMNPGYGGTYDLNEDFRSRFQFVEVQFMADDVERKILARPFGANITAEESVFLTSLHNLAKETRGGKYGYALSLRDMEQTLAALIAFKDKALALKLLEGKFDAKYTSDFRARAKSVFNIDLTNTSFWK